jgi:diacylglycerol kinase (ATP)
MTVSYSQIAETLSSHDMTRQDAVARVTGISKITAIVNPVSGSGQPHLRELNEALADYDSTIQITQGADDGKRFCSEALNNGSDLIIVYGGDGSILEVLNGLAGCEVPLLILRGGTGNLIADELGLPVDLRETLALLEDGAVNVKSIDLGVINGTTHFALRCGCGLEASALKDTEFEGKSEWGKLAYASGFLKAISEQEIIDFRIWVDDAEVPVEESGVALTVANAGLLGLGSLHLASGISMTDGLLDVCLIKKASLQTVVEFFSMNGEKEGHNHGLTSSSLIRVQQARKVRIETNPPIPFQADGDIVGETPFEIEIVPQAARVVVP